MTLPQNILRLLQSYSKQCQPQLLTNLLALQVPQQGLPTFNDQFQSEIIKTFMNLMGRSKYEDLCSLLNLVWKSLRNKKIRKTVLITILDSVLECVGVADLRGILQVIRERIGQFREVLADIAHHLLRVINTLLKRISKTTDFQVRGELHLTITRIINLCHQSGFDYRPGAVYTNNKIEVEQGLLDSFKESSMSIEFYHDFWELQKYFMDLQQLNKQDKKQGINTPNKQDPKLTSFRLKRIQIILESVINYFKINKPVENKDFGNFPLKFLKLPNLLELQLQDSYFRLVILIQAIIFCESLKAFPIRFQMEMITESKQCVKRIQKKVGEYIQELLKFRTDSANLMSMLNAFLKNDAFWINLKDSWREKKKTFFRSSSIEQNSELKKTSSLTQNPAQPQPQPGAEAAAPKKTYTLAQIALRCKKQIEKKMQIKPNFIEHFISHTEAPVLKKQPISPSFAYYYSQARRCLETFDETEQCQTQFESRSQYNLFQWKAFRSLQRQRIVPSLQSDKAGNKFADYKLLDFIKKKEDALQPDPRKRARLNQQQKQDQ